MTCVFLVSQISLHCVFNYDLVRVQQNRNWLSPSFELRSVQIWNWNTNVNVGVYTNTSKHSGISQSFYCSVQLVLLPPTSNATGRPCLPWTEGVKSPKVKSAILCSIKQQLSNVGSFFYYQSWSICVDNSKTVCSQEYLEEFEVFLLFLQCFC